MTPIPTEAERYLYELRRALSPLASAERDEIVAEVRSHLAERLSQGRGDVLAAFPPAESYAAAFVAERSLVAALVEGTPWLLSRSLWIGRIERAFSLMAAVPVALVQLFAVTLTVLGALKPIFSDQIGLWRGTNGAWAIGYMSDPRARELLGWSAVPLFIVTGSLVFFAAYRVQVALARRRLRRVRAVAPAR
jgi:uncharacterized membrane protein